MNDNDDIRVVLEPHYQKFIFTKLLKRYKRGELIKILNISSGMLYHYKNCRVGNVSLSLLNKVATLLNLEDRELNNFTKKTYSFQKDRNAILQAGREVRKEKLKILRSQIPLIEQIAENGFLNLEKWLYFYIKMLNFGARKIMKIEKNGAALKLHYTNFAKSKKSNFVNFLPCKIRIDRDFQYFFGLWVGDKCGGGRIGVMNKEKEINFYTAEYLQKLHQKVEFVLYYHTESPPILDYEVHKMYAIGGLKNGFAVSVHSINGILKSFFRYIESDLETFLGLIPNPEIFFAGLFDAEGSVLLEDDCYRWSCLDMAKVEIYIKFLSRLDLFRRYDGCNIVGYNLKAFMEKIYPFLKHRQKLNRLSLLFYGTGELEERFKGLLEYIRDNPGKTTKEIAKALKRARRSQQIAFLRNLGYVSTEGYPMKMFISEKGLATIAKGART